MAAFDGSIRVHGCYKLSFVMGSYIIKDVCTKEGVGPMRTDADTGEGVRGNTDVLKKTTVRVHSDRMRCDFFRCE